LTGFLPYRSLAQKALTFLGGANLVGLWMAWLLIHPTAGEDLGIPTYGQWVPLHLNLHLYGFIGFCLLGLIFFWLLDDLVDRNPLWSTSRLILEMNRIWAIALFIGAMTWLNGQVSGKVFLDWSGVAKSVFLGAILCLWIILLYAVLRESKRQTRRQLTEKLFLLSLLGLVVPLMAMALRTDVYPAVNPHSGGPTGTSLFASTLGILPLLFLLPTLLRVESTRTSFCRHCPLGWWMASVLLFPFLPHGAVSHHQGSQILVLALLLPWPWILWHFLPRFHWHASGQAWLHAMLWWFLVLVGTAFVMFLPGINERIKFTNTLVGHAHMALAGCVHSFCMVILCQLPLGSSLKQALGKRSVFLLWQASLVVMVLVLITYGLVEGQEPWREMMGTSLRKLSYTIRAICGALMTASSLYWVLAAWSRPGDEGEAPHA
jgi:cytochrome c oxidase cbb3-type subunit 1